MTTICAEPLPLLPPPFGLAGQQPRASKGIGLAVVRAFLDEGAVVTATSRRSTAELDATAATFVPTDLADPGGPRRMVETVLAADPHLDILINNVGGGTTTAEAMGDPLDGDDNLWDEVYALNLFATVRTTRHAVPALTRSRGAIVNTSSNSARGPFGTPLAYTSAKGASTRSPGAWPKRSPPTGPGKRRLPGGTHTDLMAGKDGYLATVATTMGINHADLLAAMPANGGMLTGSLIDPAEIARAVLLLASPLMPSTIGEIWAVDARSVKAV